MFSPQTPLQSQSGGHQPCHSDFPGSKGGEGSDCPSRQNLRVSLPTLLQVCHMPLPHYKALPGLCLLSSPSLPLSEWSWAPVPPPGSLHLSLPGLHEGGGTVMLLLPAMGCLRGLPCLPFWILSRVLSPFLPPHVPGPWVSHSPQLTPPWSQPTSACHYLVTVPVSGSPYPFPPSLLYLPPLHIHTHLCCFHSRSGP